HGKARDVKAGLPQVADVAFEFPPGHLIGLANFAIEVGRRLVEFLQGVGEERGVTSNSAVVEFAHPAGFENPDFLLPVPMRARGVNAAANFKRGGIELEDVESSEQFTVGI